MNSLLLAASLAAAAAAPRLIQVRAGKLFDAREGKLRAEMTITIRGDRIASVAPTADAPPAAGAEVIDLSRSTVLPGLIDCHVHLSSRTDRLDRFNELYEFKDTPFDGALAAVKNARATLDAGFTTVRDLGSPPFLAVDLRRSIDEGFLEGPRVVASGPGISATGASRVIKSSPWSNSVACFIRQFSTRTVKQWLLMIAGLGRICPMIRAFSPS